MSAAQLKAFDGGLAGLLMQASYPSRFDRLARFSSEKDVLRKQNEGDKEGVTFHTKKNIFIGFQPKTVLQTHSVDPLQHDAVMGPAPLAIQANLLTPFQLSVSAVPNTASKLPQRKSLDTMKCVVTNTRINLFAETKNAAGIKHSIGIEHSLRAHKKTDSRMPMALK